MFKAYLNACGTKDKRFRWNVNDFLKALKTQPFFGRVNWKQLSEKKLKPPLNADEFRNVIQTLRRNSNEGCTSIDVDEEQSCNGHFVDSTTTAEKWRIKNAAPNSYFHMPYYIVFSLYIL